MGKLFVGVFAVAEVAVGPGDRESGEVEWWRVGWNCAAETAAATGGWERGFVAEVVMVRGCDVEAGCVVLAAMVEVEVEVACA